MKHVEQPDLDAAARCVAAGETLALLHHRAVCWERAATLFIADLHLGKAATFRSAGIPVPESTTAYDLTRLSHLIARTKAERLVILGDFFHSRAGRSSDVESALLEWRSRHTSLDIILVRGNHDRASGDPDPALNINCNPEGSRLEPFTLNHHPTEPDPSTYTLAGHIHPAYRLVDHATRSTLRLPSFFIGRYSAVLPAFGAFTGMKVTHPREHEAVYVIAEGHVLKVR